MGIAVSVSQTFLPNNCPEAHKRELKDLQLQCERWLKLPNVRQIQQERVEARLPGTCDWIWSNATFTNWKAFTSSWATIVVEEAIEDLLSRVKLGISEKLRVEPGAFNFHDHAAHADFNVEVGRLLHRLTGKTLSMAIARRYIWKL